MTTSSSPFDPRAEGLFLEFLARRDDGAEPDLEDVCREHPDLAAQLRQLLAADDAASPPLDQERRLEACREQQAEDVLGEVGARRAGVESHRTVNRPRGGPVNPADIGGRGASDGL